MTTTSRLASFAVGAALLLAACGGSTDSGAIGTDVTTDAPPPTDAPPFSAGPAVTDAPAPTVATTDAPDATDASTTTAPPTTDPPPATTTAPPATDAPLTAADLVLRPGGIGPLAFGAVDPTGLIAALAPALGTPIQFTAETYPDDLDGYYENFDEEMGFDFPFGETVCFANALCAYFGGPSDRDVTFVGYFQDQHPGALATASGVTANSVLAEFSAAIAMDEGGCFSTGYGVADGVDIVLLSTGVPFQIFDEEGQYVSQVPAPSDVSVISLGAGAQPFFLFDDC